MVDVISRRAALIALAGSLAVLGVPGANAAETLRVGKAVLQNFGNMPLNIGMKYGIFQKEGLEIEELVFAGGAKLTQAMVAGNVDIGLSGGPEMAFTAKGSPQIAIATIVDSPTFMGISVGNQSTARGIDDLKGKKIGVTSAGSLTYWLVDELSRAKGWTNERDRATPVVIGGNPAAQYAALRTGSVDATLGGVSVGYQLEVQKEGRLLLPVSEYVKDIALFVTFASTAVIQQKPDAVRRFLKGWYDSVGFMKSHKAETVSLATEVIGYAPPVSERLYDGLISTFSTDGKFKQKALDKLHASFVDLQILDNSVDMSKLYTEEFLPKR